MSLLHQRLNDLFEARKKTPKGASAKKPAKAPKSRKGQAAKKAKIRLRHDAALVKAASLAKYKKEKKEKLAAKAIMVAAEKAAMKEAKSTTTSGFAKAVSALEDGKAFVLASRALGQKVPDFKAAKPYLSKIYVAMLEYMEGMAMASASKMNANVSGGSKQIGWDVEGLPTRAVKMKFASVKGPRIGNFVRRSAKTLKAQEAAIEDKKDAKKKAAKDYTGVIKSGGNGKIRIGTSPTRAEELEIEALLVVQEKVKPGSKEDKKIEDKIEALYKELAKTTTPGYVSYEELKNLKASVRPLRKAGQESAARSALATIKMARIEFIKDHPDVLAAARAEATARVEYKKSGMGVIGVGGSEGLILPHEVANEFFTNMGIATKGGKGGSGSIGKPKQGFYNVIILAGQTLDDGSIGGQDGEPHVRYQRSFGIKDAVGLVGGAFSQFSKNAVRDGGLKGGKNLTFVTLPDDNIESREGVAAWNASTESLKGNLGKFFKSLSTDVLLMKGRIANEGVDLTKQAKNLLDKGGENSTAVKRLRVSGSALVMSPSGGKLKVKLDKVKPTSSDLRNAAKGKVATPEQALAFADTKTRMSLASRLFGPVSHPLMHYNDFFSQQKSRLHTKKGSAVELAASPLRAFTSKRPSVVNWKRILGKVNIYGAVAVVIPGKGGGLIGRTIKLTGAEAEKTARGVLGTSREKYVGKGKKRRLAPGLWNDMAEFMVDQKTVRKLSRARFAPARGKSLGVFGQSDIGQDEFDTLPKTQPKRGGAEAAEVKRRADQVNKFRKSNRRRDRSKKYGGLWKLQGDAKRMKADLAKRFSRGEKPSPAFDTLVKAAAKHLGMTIKKAEAAAKVAFNTFTKSDRDKIRGMDPDDFASYVDKLPAKRRDAAKVIQLGIKGPGLTERSAIDEFLNKLSPLVETGHQQTRLVSRLRGCFAA